MRQRHDEDMRPKDLCGFAMAQARIIMKMESSTLRQRPRLRGDLGVRAIAEGPPDTLWIGTEPGDVWCFSHGVLTQYHLPEEWPNARVSALLPETDGSVWVGTLGGGLLHLENGKFTRITAEQGLPDNSITQLLEDDEGNLWGGTYAGIFRAAKSELKTLASGAVQEIAFSVHGRFDGLPGQAYSGWFQPSCWRARDGRLWFTTVKGLVAVNPHDVVVNHRPPPVVIEEMRVDGAPREFKSSVNSDENSVASAPLKIGPGRHYIEFHFTGINFTAPDKVRFKWQLEGVEKQWHEGLNQRLSGYGPLLPEITAFACKRRIVMAFGMMSARASPSWSCRSFGKRGGSKRY